MSQRCVSVASSSSLYYGLYCGLFCCLFVDRNGSLMIQETSTRTERIYVSTTMEAEGEDWDAVKIA